MKAIGASLLVLFMIVGLEDSFLSQGILLHVYGSGGPYLPIKECAELFSKQERIEVKVVGAPESEWITQAEKDADLVYGGAEYLMNQIIRTHPNLIERWTRTTLYMRAVGILVRKGNPKQLKSLDDLAKTGVRLLVVDGANQVGMWEDLARSTGLIRGIRKNVVLSVSTSAEAVEKWKTAPGIDAWITFESWYYELKDFADLVRLPVGERIYRGTCIAITRITKNRDLARKFIDFLKTDAAHAVFQKWGWEKNSTSVHQSGI